MADKKAILDEIISFLPALGPIEPDEVTVIDVYQHYLNEGNPVTREWVRAKMQTLVESGEYTVRQVVVEGRTCNAYRKAE